MMVDKITSEWAKIKEVSNSKGQVSDQDMDYDLHNREIMALFLESQSLDLDE